MITLKQLAGQARKVTTKESVFKIGFEMCKYYNRLYRNHPNLKQMGYDEKDIQKSIWGKIAGRIMFDLNKEVKEQDLNAIATFSENCLDYYYQHQKDLDKSDRKHDHINALIFLFKHPPKD